MKNKFGLLVVILACIGYLVFFDSLGLFFSQFLPNCTYFEDVITYSAAISPTGNVWFTVNGGLLEFTGEEWIPHPEPNQYISGGAGGVIEFDQDGRLWFGSTAGVMVYDGANWAYYVDNQWQLPRTRVTSIAFDPEGQAWIGLARHGSLRNDPGGGITIFDGETWTTFHTRFDQLTTYDDILTIEFDPLGRPWIGTAGGALAVIDEITSYSPNGGERTNSYQPSPDAHDQENEPELHIPDENIISTWVDKDGTTFYQVYSATTYSRYQTDRLEEVKSIAFDEQENTWVYAGNALFKLDGEALELMNTIENEVLKQITVDPDGNIWFGLERFDGKEWDTFTTRNSCIGGNLVHNIAFDSAGTGYAAHTYYPEQIGVTVFTEQPNDNSPIILKLETIVVPRLWFMRLFIPSLLLGIWVLAYKKAPLQSYIGIFVGVLIAVIIQQFREGEYSSIYLGETIAEFSMLASIITNVRRARNGNLKTQVGLRETLSKFFSRREIPLTKANRKIHGVLAGLPHFCLMLLLILYDDLMEWSDKIKEITHINFDFISIPKFLAIYILFILVFLGWKWKKPVWSGSWLGNAFFFMFIFGVRIPQLPWALIGFCLLLLVWLISTKPQSGVLLTVSLTTIVIVFLYQDVWNEIYFYEVHLLLLAITSYMIVVAKKWVWPTIGGLVVTSLAATYALMNYNAYMGQSPHLPFIPTNRFAAVLFFFLAFRYQSLVTFLPLVLCRRKSEF